MPVVRSRRDFLWSMLAVATAWPAMVRAQASSDHPTPRPGITAVNVPLAWQLADTPDAVAVFDMVRQIPEVVDGIRCNCGCASLEGYYSLLTCYEGANAMARSCVICQSQGRLAFRLHKAGKSLDEIRKGIDARFG